MLLKKYLVLMILVISCTGGQHDLKKPITFQARSYDSDMQYLFLAIHEGAYSRIYNELFSPYLKQQKSLKDFTTEMRYFEEKYGPLIVDLSYTQSITSSTTPFFYSVSLVLEYKNKTIFADFLFGGSEKDMKLEDYTFFEN